MNQELNSITEAIIGAGIEVHRALGLGLLESAYEACLAHELTLRGVQFERQRPLPVLYRGVQLDCGYRLDLVVEIQIIVELKTVDKLHPVHEAQLLSYLRLARVRVGLIMNFHVKVLKDGIKRMIVDPIYFFLCALCVLCGSICL
ncbi:MAG: GxxExxY protein [Gemmataceae bacterium]